ncbi:TetR/AcrR family transcriptional regulator [Nonomuraea basaltis]|nr:TetR/AcrR family transcriptional regulator [Nonomuraea basaltis]
MRALAQALGIGTASLYTYVPGKAELLELMVERVVGGRPLPDADGGWRAGLRDLAASDLAAYRAHPWLLQVATSRTVFGPNVIARYDAALGLLDGVGLAAIDVAGCVAAVESYTRGAASAVVEAELAPVQTGSSDDEWWERRAPLLGERMNGRFPRLAALEEAGAFAVSDTVLPYTLQRALDRFHFGLDLVLDSIGGRIAAARG